MATPTKLPPTTPHAGYASPAHQQHLGLPPSVNTQTPTTPYTIPGATITTTPLPSPPSHHSPSHAATHLAMPPAALPSKHHTTPSSSSSSRPTARKVGKYILGKTLGQGTFGKVKQATDTETGRLVAIKMMDKAKIRANNMGEQIKKEISIMKLIKHPSVIQLIEVLASATTIYIVLELVTGGELFDKIVSEGNFNESEARHYYQQLIGGISQCHSRGVMHRDLKPENLLLDESGMLKISDFGLSALSNDVQSSSNNANGGGAGDLLHTTCGTPNYVAPEVLLYGALDKGYDGRAADVWSSGVILYVLLAGFLPFDETSMVELFRKIVKADFAYPSTLSHEAVDLLSIILNPDPEKRATIEQIKNHPWYRGITMEQARIEQEELERQRQAGGMPSLHRMPSMNGPTTGDVNSAITWLGDEKSKSNGTAATSSNIHLQASPTNNMRSLQLDFANGKPTPPSSMSTTPTNIPSAQLTSPNSPGVSPNLGPSIISSATASPQSGSVQQRTNSKKNATASASDDSDPLGLDDEEIDIKGPISLNAFDLINMVGGAAMGRMFQRGTEKKVNTFTQFTTGAMKIDEIIPRLITVLKSIPETEYRVYTRQCIIKASKTTARGKILGSCQLYQMTPTLFMVEWRKMKGDVFLFHDFFKEIKKKFSGEESIDTAPGVATADASKGMYSDDEDDQPTAAAASSASAACAASKSIMDNTKPSHDRTSFQLKK